MGFGITGLVNAVTAKALIRYVPKDSKYSLEEIDEQTLGDYAGLSSYAAVGMVQNVMGRNKDFQIKNISPDVKKGNSLRMVSDITEYALEDGSIVAQHIIQNPIEVTLTFEETNAGKAIGNLMGAAAEEFFGMKDQSTYDKLVEIWEDKLKVEIITDNDIYKNMVLKSAPIVENAPYRGAYKVMATFRELVDTNPENKKKPKTMSLAKACMKMVKGGLQVAQKVGG